MVVWFFTRKNLYSLTDLDVLHQFNGIVLLLMFDRLLSLSPDFRINGWVKFICEIFNGLAL